MSRIAGKHFTREKIFPLSPLDDLLNPAMPGQINGQTGMQKPSAGYGADGESDDDNLAELVARFEEAEDATEDARKAAERDRDYYDGKQYTSAELKVLRDRGQPDIVINRIKPKIDFLAGYEASNRTDPRAFPRTPQDQEASEAATDALRYQKDASDLDQKFSLAWSYLLCEGVGGIELTLEPDPAGGDPEIVPIEWDWDRLFWDPHSRKHDFSDARYMGGVMWMDADEAIARWREAAEAIELTLNDASASRTFDDRPNRWVAALNRGSTRKRVRIVQMYYKEGDEWRHCTFTKGGKLEEVTVPFTDDKGRSWCPLLLQSAYVDRENNRYGLIRIMIGVQDEINKRRSKALHRLTMRQVHTEHGAVDDVDATKKELAKPDGFVVTNPGFTFELLDKGNDIAAELNLLQEAKNEIELMGPNAALLGKQEGAASGKAILANQQSGQTEIAMLLDRHRHLKKRTYQRIWDLIRQYKKAEWWVRVTDDEKNVKFVGLNRPVTMLEELQGRIMASGVPEEEARAQLANIQQQAQADPMMAQQLQQVVRTEHVAADMQMDITIEEVPDVASVQEEQFQQLTSLAPAVVFPPQVYIEASSLRNKKRLLEIMNGKEQQDPVQAETQRIMGELTIKKASAEVNKLIAETLKVTTEADVLDGQIGMIVKPGVTDAGGNQPSQPDQVAQPGPSPDAQSVPAAEAPTGAPTDQPPPGFTGA